ncbi:MAG: DUF3108 domain-containing protein [Burkholderiaceae bacterium]|nr:DUF3108 domain-containing protein [Burkholderiaceae bacterium]
MQPTPADMPPLSAAPAVRTRMPLARVAATLTVVLLLHALALSALRGATALYAPAAPAALRPVEATLIVERPPAPRPQARLPARSVQTPRRQPAASPEPAARAPQPPATSQTPGQPAEAAPPLALETHLPTAEAETPPLPAVVEPATVAEGVDVIGQLPGAATYVYRMTDSRYPALTGTTVLQWRLDAASRRYEATLSTRVFELSIADITSRGTVREAGLAPERYVQKTATRAAVATNIDWSRQRVTFSRRSDELPAREGLQDRLSFQFQLMALARAQPQALRPGAVVSMPVAGTGEVETYEFLVIGRETLTLESGPIETVKLDRGKGPGAEARVEVWLAPQQGWLPVKLRFTDRRGNVTESELRNVDEAGRAQAE